MNEQQAIKKVIDILSDHDLGQGTDYQLNHIENGCFDITLCPKTSAVLDIQYFYNNIPDIKIFRIHKRGRYMNILLKVKLRGDCK